MVTKIITILHKLERMKHKMLKHSVKKFVVFFCFLPKMNLKIAAVFTNTSLNTDVNVYLFSPPIVNPFAPGWEEVCQQVPYDCEDATNMKVQEVLCQPPLSSSHV